MTTLGFVGLGVMGNPMCRNVATKHDGKVMAFDAAPHARDGLRDTHARVVSRIEEIWDRADAVFLSLPGGPQVESVCLGPEGLCGRSRKLRFVVDLSTTSVATARNVGDALNAVDVQFADAPVARTREAAQQERGDGNVPTPLLWGRVCEHVYVSLDELSMILARLGARR